MNQYKKKTNLRSNDRILVLRPIPGKEVLASSGMVDNRLFKEEGGNTLHALRSLQRNTWTFKYENGILPLALKGRFTSFDRLLTHAKRYFESRGLQITEIIDVDA